MSISVVAKIEETATVAAKNIADGLSRRVLAVVENASKAGAAEARKIIVDKNRVDTGRMRDSTVEFPAVETATGADGGFRCRVSYAIYNEYGTINMSGIHFMELGAAKARKELREGLSELARGGTK